MTTFANKVKEAVASKGMPLTELAKKMGISYPTLLKATKGTSKPNKATLPKFAKLLDLSVEEVSKLSYSKDRIKSVKAKVEAKEFVALKILKAVHSFKTEFPNDDLIAVLAEIKAKQLAEFEAQQKKKTEEFEEAKKKEQQEFEQKFEAIRVLEGIK